MKNSQFLVTVSFSSLLLCGISLGDFSACAQPAELFAEQKTLWQAHQRQRMGVMQGADRCVAAAKNTKQFRSCLDKERSIIRNLERKHWSELRSLYQRFGINLPNRKPGQNAEKQPMI